MATPAAPTASSNQNYVDLSPKFAKGFTWSNDPNDLMLVTYFSQNQPNLATDFNIDSLKPIVREKDEDTFLLVDAENSYYIWNIEEGLFLLKNLGTGNGSVDDVVLEVMRYHHSLVKHQIWNTSYPSDKQ